MGSRWLKEKGKKQKRGGKKSKREEGRKVEVRREENYKQGGKKTRSEEGRKV